VTGGMNAHRTLLATGGLCRDCSRGKAQPRLAAMAGCMIPPILYRSARLQVRHSDTFWFSDTPAAVAMRASFRDSFRVLQPDATEVGTFNGVTMGQTSGDKIDFVFVGVHRVRLAS